MRLFGLFILFTLLPASQLPAQNELSYAKKSISTGINSDAFGGIEIAYNTGISLWKKPSEIQMGISYPLLLNLKETPYTAFGINAAIENLTIQKKSFLLKTGIGMDLLFHKQISGTFFPIGIHFKAIPAFRIKNGYIGMLCRYHQTLATYIHFSHYALERFDDIYDTQGNLINIKPRDGFFRLTAQRLEIGLSMEFPLFSRYRCSVETGYVDYLSPYTNAFNAMMFGQIPVFMNCKFKIPLIH